VHQAFTDCLRSLEPEMHLPGCDSVWGRSNAAGNPVAFEGTRTWIADSGRLSVIPEARIHFKRYNAVRSLGDVISSILNCVCPDCGGRLGEPGKEFKCQGECRTDWRAVWERALSSRSTHDVRGGPD
jgi:hypothetical protein